jgi:hypothetical protein
VVLEVVLELVLVVVLEVALVVAVAFFHSLKTTVQQSICMTSLYR